MTHLLVFVKLILSQNIDLALYVYSLHEEWDLQQASL